MKKTIVAAVAVVMTVALALPVAAQPEGPRVGLGVSIGACWPEGTSPNLKFNDWSTSFNWGFYVDIPLVWTFHITPSAELYRFGNVNATDINLAFKFIINVWRSLDLFLGVVPGLTSLGNDTLFNVGGLAGLSFNLFSNLDLFLQAKYDVIIEDQNKKVLHANVGVLFHF